MGPLRRGSSQIALRICASRPLCILGFFFKFSNFIGWWGLDSGGPRCINMPNFIKIGKAVFELLQFFNFQDSSRHRRWVLKFSFFISWWGLEGRGASLRQMSSTSVSFLRYHDFWRPSILDLFGTYLDYPRWVLGGLYHCAKFGCDRCSRWIFGAFGLKTPIQATKSRIWENLSPLKDSNINETPKMHILTQVHVVWAIKGEHPPTGLTCRWVPKKRV